MKNDCLIRIVREEDSREILDIYRPYILETAVTFEEEVPAFENFKKRIEEVVKQSPYLVCEVDGKVIGYAYGAEYRSRAAYRWNREVSVYIHSS